MFWKKQTSQGFINWISGHVNLRKKTLSRVNHNGKFLSFFLLKDLDRYQTGLLGFLTQVEESYEFWSCHVTTTIHVT